jgi:predicted RNase H-like nuclease (RuvC/YqgF family)
MEYNIEKMRDELEELQDKVNDLNEFLEKEMERPKLTNESERVLIALQVSYMEHYRYFLERRIIVLNK